MGVRSSRLTNQIVPTGIDSALAKPSDLSSDAAVARHLSALLERTKEKGSAAAALVPWFCDRLPSAGSREAYLRDLAAFVAHMREQGLDPLAITGDHLRMYKAAMQSAGQSSATIARRLSVLRGTYEQFAKRGLLSWEAVKDIQSVESPRVERNTTPALSEAEARRLLHAPDKATLLGLRDHALLFTYFKTACRCSAIIRAKVGDIDRTDTDHYLVVTEKGGRRQRKALLEAASPVLTWLVAAGIQDDLEGPLFRPLAKNRESVLRGSLDRRTVWVLVRKYARQIGIDINAFGGRALCVHSLRKTAITNALEHGAKMEQAQALAGHADIRTTQLYFQARGTEAEEAARHIQIR